MPKSQQSCSGILEQSMGGRNRFRLRVVIPARKATYVGREAGTTTLCQNRLLAPVDFSKIPALDSFQASSDTVKSAGAANEAVLNTVLYYTSIKSKRSTCMFIEYVSGPVPAIFPLDHDDF